MNCFKNEPRIYCLKAAEGFNKALEKFLTVDKLLLDGLIKSILIAMH